MVFGGTRRRGLNNTSMSEDGSLFQAQGEESPNGAPRKMHAFCGVPGLEGEIKITREARSLRERV